MKKILSFILLISLIIIVTPIYTFKAEGLPFKADLENLYKYNIGAGNVSDIGYDYDPIKDSVRLYLDGNVSGYSPLEFNIEIDIDEYPILSFEISECSIFWALKIADNNTGGADYAFYGDDRSDNLKFSHDMRTKISYTPGIDESDPFPGYSSVHVFKLKIYVVDKTFSGGSFVLKGLQISRDGYTGEYSQGIKLNDRPEYIDETSNTAYLRRKEYEVLFEELTINDSIVTGIPAGLSYALYVFLGLNIVIFITFFFKLVYPKLMEEREERKKGEL